MKKRLIKLVGCFAVAYFILRYISPELANSSLVVFLIVLIPVLVVRHVFVQFMYQHSISMVGRQFIMGHNTIYNDYCTIKYEPNVQIIVTDNVTVTRRREVRQFIVSKSNGVNINRLWNKICRVFDSFITLDTMAKFCSYDAKIDIKMIKESKDLPEEPKVEIMIEEQNREPRFVDIEDIQPDIYAADSNKPQAQGDNFVDMSQMKQREKETEREIPEPEFIEMSDALNVGPNKINVNSALESEFMILPGMTKEKAKEIVEYRSANGFFDSREKFYEVAGFSEEDILKIKDMIDVTTFEKGKSEGD